jgi:hypothetical protein
LLTGTGAINGFVDRACVAVLALRFRFVYPMFV